MLDVTIMKLRSYALPADQCKMRRGRMLRKALLHSTVMVTAWAKMLAAINNVLETRGQKFTTHTYSEMFQYLQNWHTLLWDMAVYPRG